MSNKIIGKNYPLSFILVNGYINRLNPIHKHTFDLICLYNHLMIYKYSIVFFINIDRFPQYIYVLLSFHTLLYSIRSLTLSTAIKIDKSNKGSIPKHM